MINKQEILTISNDRLRRMATFASISVACVLVAAKLAAWLATDSVSMLSSMFDSMFDLVASMVTAFGVASALRPPDREHRYGHGKAEPLAALAQSVMIIVSSALLAYEAIGRLYHPQEVVNDGVAYGVMGLSIVLTLLLVSFQHRVVNRTGSAAIGADRMHYVGDVAANFAVVAAFLLHQWTGLDWFDSVFALAIVAGLLYSALRILKHSLIALMDAELPQDQRDKIVTIVQAQRGVLGMHDLRTRTDGERVFIEFHVEMDGATTLLDAHRQVDRISLALKREFPIADISIHQDPAGLIEDRLDARIERVEGDKG